MKHALRIAVMALSLATVLVFAGPAEPADALIDGGTIVAPVIETVTSNPTVTGGWFALCPITCTATAAGGVFVGTALLTNEALEWVFGGDHEVDTAVTPSTTTTANAGCFASLFGTDYADCTVNAKGAQVYDAYSGATPFASASGGTLNETFRIIHAPARGSTTDYLTIEFGWSGSAVRTTVANFTPRCFNNVGLTSDTACASASGAGVSWNPYNEAGTATSGLLTHTWQYSDLNTSGKYGWSGFYDAQRGTAKWWSHAAPSYGVVAPSHRWRGVKICSGGTSSLLSAVFKEADASIPDLPVPSCTGTLERYTVYETDAAGTTDQRIVLDWTAPTTATTNGVDVSDCLEGGSAYPCSLRLLKVSPSGLLDCSRADVDCTSYVADTSTELEYQCRWGTHVVPVVNCRPFESALAAPDPGTEPGAGTDADVINGDDRPDLLTDPDAPNGDCMGGGWGWNPIEWVLKPVKCALSWAFVPQQDHLGEIQDAYNGSVVESLVQPVDAIAGTVTRMRDELGGSVSCEGPTAQVPMFGSDDFTFQPLNSCSGPAQTAAGVVKTGLSFVFLVLGGLAVARTIVGSFGIRLMGYPGGDDS